MDSIEKTRDNETIEIKIQGGKFKQFDIINDASSFSDHHYYNCRPKKYNDQLMNRIYEEWDILTKLLRDSIFVRVNRERPDLLRAVIIGPQGSPYHDGLFFFDIQFPPKYPDVPPKIHYCCYDVVSMNHYIQSHSLEKFFLKGKDTLIIFLCSILRSQVYTANTLLYCDWYNSEQETLMYKEEVFINNWNTMVSVLNKPPKCFEEFVAQHFHDQAETILTTCKAYIGVRVKRADTDIPKLWQENFDSMESIYYKLVTTFQKNGSSLENLCKLGIKFHGKKSSWSRGATIVAGIGAGIGLISLVIFTYFVWREVMRTLIY